METQSSTIEAIEPGLAAEPLRALRRGLTRADGFALYVAVIKNPAQRNQLIKLLGEAMPAIKLHIVTLRAESTDILDEVQKQLDGKISGPVMVTGLEEVLSSDTQSHPILNALNLRRTDWPQLVPQPVVFWLPEYLLPILARSAPDFLDWRSDTLHFPDIEPEQLQILQSATWDSGLDTRMPAEARLERIKELESLVAMNEHSSDPVICGTVIDWLNELGLHLSMLGKTQEALSHFQEVLSLARKLGDKRKEGAALANLGITYSDLGDTQKPIELFKQGLEISRQIGDKRAESDMLGNVASANSVLGNLVDAFHFYEQSLKLHLKLGDQRGQGRDFQGIGVIFAEQHKFREAIAYYERALEVFRQIGAKKEESDILGNIGVAYKQLGEARKAITLFEQSLAIGRKLGDRLGESQDLVNLGNTYSMLGELRKAIEFYEQSLAIARATGDRRAEGAALFSSAITWNKLGNRAQAIASAEAALRIFETIKSPYASRVRAKLAEWRAAKP